MRGWRFGGKIINLTFLDRTHSLTRYKPFSRQ